MKNILSYRTLAACWLVVLSMWACDKKKDAEPKSIEKSITAFSFVTPAVTATVDNSAKTITGTLPVGTDATNLSPTIVVSSKAIVSPASGVAQDFTKPVVYTVTAEDGSKQTYTATISVTKATGKDMLSFSFNALSPVVSATIDAAAKTISATLPVGSSVTALVPTFTVSERATVTPASGVAQDFSKVVTYTVTAEDGTTQAYTSAITVLVLPSVTTGAASGITTTGFAMAGNLTATGSAGITQYGHVWSTTVALPTVADSRTSLGATAAARTFSSDVTGLSANTLYNVRAYATSPIGTVYGAAVQVRTSASAELPTITTSTANSILSTSAKADGEVGKAGTSALTQYGHVWSAANQTPTVADSKTTLTAAGTFPLRFTSDLSGLVANTTYYLRAYATSASGTSYSAVNTFKTSDAGNELNIIKGVVLTGKTGNKYTDLDQTILLSLNTGKVYKFSEGAANSNDIDVILSLYSNKEKVGAGSEDVILYSPTGLLLKDLFWGNFPKVLADQDWPVYKGTKIDYFTVNTYPPGVWWDKINSVSDLTTIIAKDYVSYGSELKIVDSKGNINDDRLYVFKTKEGKNGIFKVTNANKKSDSYAVTIDIKVQK